MPRPNAAQLAYGSATVVFATVAMLLLSRTTTGPGIALIGLAALLLGLLVALTLPVSRPRTTAPARAAGARKPDATAGDGVRTGLPGPRARGSEHSLRR
ncbi:hypothetical protein [Streptomyces sp. SP18CS02]|uniref:hypothetical protein n=1 Tax=Streptomyces sp. SP18CS02 TaxID=3002531 RepID=UPI002E779E26|nr:hypothetical protein [Streptomyces sp. SP18CS02]MEE1752288.1 hypothetical protein [Streptomyces sp. SP18CS02]